MLLTPTIETKTLARIVADDFRTAQIFERYNLDFCCKGKRQLGIACQEKGIQVADVVTDLESLQGELNNSQRFNDWSPAFLAEYIIQQHHRYVKTMIPTIEAHLQKVVNAHGTKHPEVFTIQKCFVTMSDELLTHIGHEESSVFPIIKNVSTNQELSYMAKAEVNELARAIGNLDDEHLTVGNTLAIIQTLTNNFTPPPGACTTFRVLYQELKAFQEDMFRHIHLENNILFPKVLAMRLV